jgi:hypothetical protein
MRKTSFVIALILVSAVLVGCAGAAPTAAVVPTNTAVPANTATPIATPEPPTATSEPPTATSEPPTATPEPPTPTPEPPTVTPEPATATPEPPTPETAEDELTWTADGLIAEGEYAHQAEGAGVTLYWLNDAEHLYAAISAQTTGWVAVAFDPEQAMMGANFVFGYVQDGNLFLEDMYGTKPSGPDAHPPDEQLGGSNDILDSAGSERAGTTVIEFKIPLDSGDQYDKPLIPGASYTALLAVGGTDDYTSYHIARGATQITLD